MRGIEAKQRLEWVQRALYVRPGPLAQLISFAQRSGDPAFLSQSLAALPKVRMGNTIGYASLVSTLSATNNLDEMFFVYARMKEERVPLNIFSAGALINASLRHNKLERAFEVLHDMKLYNLRIDNGLVNSFVTYFLEKRDVDRLLSVLDALGDRSDLSIDRVSILDELWQRLSSPHEDSSLAYRFIERLSAAVPPASDGTTQSTASGQSQQLHQRQQGETKEGENEGGQGEEGDGRPQESEADKWARVGAYWHGRMDQLLNQLVTRGQLARAHDLTELMVSRWRLQPHKRIITVFIRACITREAAINARGGVISGDDQRRPVQLLDEVGRMVEEGRLEADLITFTALIDANARLRRMATALRFFELMQQRGIKADTTTYRVLLIMCSVLRDKKEGLRLLDQAEREGVGLEMALFTDVVRAIRALPDATPA